MNHPIPDHIIAEVAWHGVQMEVRSTWPSIQFLNQLLGKFRCLQSMFPDNLEYMARANEANFLVTYLMRHNPRTY